jgi:hypothetical protein
LEIEKAHLNIFMDPSVEGSIYDLEGERKR